MKRLIAALIALLCLASGAIAEENTLPALHVEGSSLVNEAGKRVVLRGVSTHGLSWFAEYVNDACFKQLHDDMHVSLIRLVLFTEDYCGYCTGGDREALKATVDEGVRYATDNGMYVIIDWHILSDGNPNRHADDAEEFFSEMAKKYAGHTNVMYEICNEPNGDVTWADVRAYAQRIIPVIREKDENGIVLVGTPNWSQEIGQAAAEPIEGVTNVMYTVHFYAASHGEWLRENMVSAIDAGLPVFVSEFGLCDASGGGAIDETQSRAWLDLLEEQGISYAAWSLSNKDETSALIDSLCDKTNGFLEDDLSESGRMIFSWIRAHA